MITRKMTMGEIIDKYPFAAEIMLSYGLHCVGCHVKADETLEEGARVHGMSEEEIGSLLKELNDMVRSYNRPVKDPKITMTKLAAGKVLELMKAQKKSALRVAFVNGSYAMEFDEPDKDDFVFEEHGVKLVIDKKSMRLLNGVEIDYAEGPEGSGFRFDRK